MEDLQSYRMYIDGSWVDVDGESRSESTPDIGGDEH